MHPQLFLLLWYHIAPMPALFVWIKSVTRGTATRCTSYIWPGCVLCGHGGTNGPDRTFLFDSGESHEGARVFVIKRCYVDFMARTGPSFLLDGRCMVLTYLRFPVHSTTSRVFRKNVCDPEPIIRSCKTAGRVEIDSFLNLASWLVHRNLCNSHIKLRTAKRWECPKGGKNPIRVPLL